jgi:hypothetical protein
VGRNPQVVEADPPEQECMSMRVLVAYPPREGARLSPLYTRGGHGRSQFLKHAPVRISGKRG